MLKIIKIEQKQKVKHPLYKGVFKDKRRPNKWRASIMKGNKIFYLGSFDIEIEAAKDYNEAALKYFTNPLLNDL